MYRTYDKSQQFEKQYEIFVNNENKKMRPCVRFFITATPVPVLIALQEEKDKLEGGGTERRAKNIRFERTAPCDDYLGVDEMVSFLLVEQRF